MTSHATSVPSRVYLTQQDTSCIRYPFNSDPIFGDRLHRAYNEYTRLFEGELIRLCMRTSHGDIDLRPFWPLLFNRQGGLDGTHDWGETHVCYAFTTRPLHELVATGEFFRAKPPWAGLASGLCQPHSARSCAQERPSWPPMVSWPVTRLSAYADCVSD
jgi:hypothetical protein